MSDHMPRKDAELPPRMPEAAIIAELRAELAQVKAAAAAAVALVVERAAEGADFAKNRLEAIADEGWNGDARDFKRSIPGVFSELDAIRALAHVDGLAEVQALRAERDGLTQNAEATNGIWQANLRLIAERDTLAAEVVRLKEQVAGLVEAVNGLKKPGDCVRSCTTTGGPSHEGQKWIHWADYQELRRRIDAALAQAQPAAEEGK